MTTKYTFEPTTRLRLEIERDPEPGEYVNLIANPSAELGAWGWRSPKVGSYVQTGLYAGGFPAITYITAAGPDNEFRSELIAVTPGEDIRARWDLIDAPTAGYRVRFRWYDYSGNSVPGAPSISDDITWPSTTNHWTSVRTVPAGVAFASLTFEVTNADFTDYTVAGASFAVREVKVFSSAMGPLTDEAMLTHAYAPEVLWENVLGPTIEITTKREEFDLGTMSATILDATIDPAVVPTIRPGRRVRLTALTEPVSGEFLPLFTGTVDTATVQYDLRGRKASDPKHARIDLTAVDGMQILGSTPRRDGVDFVHELPDVLEAEEGSLPLPWDCDGVTGQIPSATLTSTNDNASAADQVALTRDGNLGYAWIDRRGVVMVRSVLPATVNYTFDESVYSELDLSFDPRRLINSLDVRTLTYDSGTGETTELTNDPVVDVRSIQTWGKRHRTFTMTAGQFARFADFPATVFAANANPKVQPLSVTIPLLTDPDRAARAFVDIYDLVQVLNTDKVIDELLRVTSVQHRISTDKWLMDVGFAGDTTVAIPQRQPSR